MSVNSMASRNESFCVSAPSASNSAQPELELISSPKSLKAPTLTWSDVPASVDTRSEDPADAEVPIRKAYDVHFVSELPFKAQKIFRTEPVIAKEELLNEIKPLPEKINWLSDVLTEAKPLVTHCLTHSPFILSTILSTVVSKECSPISEIEPALPATCKMDRIPAYFFSTKSKTFTMDETRLLSRIKSMLIRRVDSFMILFELQPGLNVGDSS